MKHLASVMSPVGRELRRNGRRMRCLGRVVSPNDANRRRNCFQMNHLAAVVSAATLRRTISRNWPALMAMEEANAMKELGHHLVLKLRDGGIIASTVERRRALARIVFEQARHDGLIGW